MLPQRSDAGRALGRDEERKLLESIAQSRSLTLYPFFVLSLDAACDLRKRGGFVHSNLQLKWRQDAIEAGEIIVGRSKTEAGTGRVVPLTRRACVALATWLTWFPGAGPDS
jgi:integrase